MQEHNAWIEAKSDLAQYGVASLYSVSRVSMHINFLNFRDFE